MSLVSIREARAALSRLVEQVLSGEEVVITRRGKPVVRLVPVEEASPHRKPGALKGLFELPKTFFEPLPDDFIDAFYNSPIEPAPDEQPRPRAVRFKRHR